jgi:HEAT repeat protein
MECEVIQKHFPDHLAGSLSPAEADAVAAHLAICPMCAAEFEDLGDTWERLGDLPHLRVDSAGMRARFDASLTAQPLGMARRRAWPIHAGGYGLQFAAAAALVILGVVIGRQMAPAPTVDPQIAGMRDELRDMRQIVTLSLLQQQSASERLKGVSYTSQIEQPGSEVTAALLDALMHDPNDNVRLRAVDALRRFADHAPVRRGAIDALPRQTSPLVQMELIEFVLEVGGRDAADALRRLSSDPMVNEAVRAQALRGLTRLGA